MKIHVLKCYLGSVLSLHKAGETSGGYDLQEKMKIAEQYLVPNAMVEAPEILVERKPLC